MWPRRTHIPDPLTELYSSKRKFTWTDSHDNSFLSEKKFIAEDVLLWFPDHAVPFEISIDASNYQIGATIKQRNLPIAYFLKKLNPTQRRYSTIEQEMLVIVEVFKEYRNFLLGAQITIYNDNKKLLSNATVNDRVFRRTDKIQEYRTIIMYIKGQKELRLTPLVNYLSNLQTWNLC